MSGSPSLFQFAARFTFARLVVSPVREPQENRRGYQLYRQVREAIESHALRSRVDVKPTPCLSICPRPCGIALSLAGSWTYLFGDQDPESNHRRYCRMSVSLS